MSRNSKPHTYSGLHAPKSPTPPPSRTKPKPKPKAITTIPATNPILLNDQVVRERVEASIASAIKLAEERVGQELPHVKAFMRGLLMQELLEFHLVLDLLAYFIDTETKFAKGVLKIDDHLLMIRTTRKRLKSKSKTISP